MTCPAALGRTTYQLVPEDCLRGNVHVRSRHVAKRPGRAWSGRGFQPPAITLGPLRQSNGWKVL
jgi:hypothetical protein